MLINVRKPVFPRIVFFLFLYFVIFVSLASVQFAKRDGFTQNVGSFVVSGRYSMPDKNDASVSSGEYLLNGDVHVFFGGMDFGMFSGNNGLSFFSDEEGETRVEMLPERMRVSGDSAIFTFPDGTELLFSSHYIGGAPEMQISGVFKGDIAGIELPIKPLRRTEVRDIGDGRFIVIANGLNYSFGRSRVDTERRVLLIKAAGVSYRAIPTKANFSLEDFVLAQAETQETYSELLTLWRDRNFSLWNSTVTGQNNEDLLTAFAEEALVRGSYREALAAGSPIFLRNASQAYEPSVFFGNTDQAYRSLIAEDREKNANLTRQIDQKSLEFLLEPHVFEYFTIRGNQNLINAGAELIRTIDPDILALDIIPGIFEGYMDWKTFRPGVENPFENLMDRAFTVVFESLRRLDYSPESSMLNMPGDIIFSFIGNEGSTEFNLRLGMAIQIYAEDVQNTTWAGIGRSLILSALSLGDTSGAVKAGLILSENGVIKESPASPELNTARLYRNLRLTDMYPRALAIGNPASNIWTWTTARTVSAVQRNDDMDISVNFPAGEIHYMIIRNIQPFVRIQLNDTNYRADPQFERYDSSGWRYVQQEQCLIIKLRHRTAAERIRIIFREQAPAVITEPETANNTNAPPPVTPPQNY